MQDFQTLVRALIERRFDGSESRLAEALEVNRSTVHRIAPARSRSA
jgi:plasmid maintenance system antidote protein VapI